MFSYTIFIMLLPLLSFIVLGLAGMKMKHKVAGLIGTCSLALEPRGIGCLTDDPILWSKTGYRYSGGYFP